MSSSISLEYYHHDKAALSVYNNTNSLISVLIGGASIPLPEESYSSGFRRTSNSKFVVEKEGVYLISYSIQISIGLTMSSSVYRNGEAIEGLVKRVTISLGSSTANFSASAVSPLGAGDELELRLYGVLGSGTLTGGVGAFLNIIKVM